MTIPIMIGVSYECQISYDFQTATFYVLNESSGTNPYFWKKSEKRCFSIVY